MFLKPLSRPLLPVKDVSRIKGMKVRSVGGDSEEGDDSGQKM